MDDRHLPSAVRLPQLEREILDALPQTLLLVDEEGRIAFANAAAEGFFGRSAGSLVDIRAETLFGSSHAVCSILARARRDGSLTVARDVALSGRHQGRTADIQAVPIADEGGDVLLVIAMRAQASSPQPRSELEGAARSAFGLAAMLAHEIENPLSGIRGAAQLLERTEDAKRRSLARLIRDEVDRIRRLVDQLEQFSDDRPLSRQALNIHSVLDHVRALLAGEAENGAAGIAVAYDPSLPMVLGNRDALVQIFLNLMKNALQVTMQEEESGVRAPITVSTSYRHGVRAAGPDGTMRSVPIEVAVIDRGPGIDPALRGHIFEPFVTGREGGRGLGLAMVAKLVAAHGGLVELDTGATGTCVRVLLPAAGEGKGG